MRIKLLVFIVLLNFYASYGQSLSCIYSGSSSTYTCSLTINNPNGFNNFTSIGGVHLSGMTNSNVRIVTRSSGTTTNIPSIICDTFQNLTKITLTSAGIQMIDERAFENCERLQTLWLDSNRISNIHENAFIQNTELIFITFNVNQITYVHEHLFKNQHKLIELRLCSSPLSDMPGNIFQSLRNLNILHLESNLLKDLRIQWFSPLVSLQTLLLEYNRIDELPLNVFSSLPNLYDLYLNGNNLTVIHSDSFRGASSLRYIYFENNQIYAVDEKVIDYTGVHTLNLYNNICYNQNIVDTSPPRTYMREALQTCFENYAGLTPDPNNTIDCLYMETEYGYTCRATINNPNGFDNFTRIGGVHLPGKNDSNVQAVIGIKTVTPNIPRIFCNRFLNVETIFYIQISIKYFGPEAFANCYKLWNLNIWNNQLQELDFFNFINNDKLERLDMRYNRISNMLVNLNWSFSKIKSLNLEYNNLTFLEPDWFLGLWNLTYLNLQYNKIEDLPENVFINMTSLEQLVMNNNKLKVIHSYSFGIKPLLTNASFVNNQIYAVDERFVDDTGLINIDMRGNICANTNIIDRSPTRDFMKAALKDCFQNYRNLYGGNTSTTTPQCPIGNLDERVCILERENEELKKRIEALENRKNEF